MKLLYSIAVLLITATAAYSQDTPVVIGEIFEHKVVVNVGPISPNKQQNEYTVSLSTERQAENEAVFACSIYGRYAYPISISESEGCLIPANSWLHTETEFTSSNPAHGCFMYYLYACGTHLID